MNAFHSVMTKRKRWERLTISITRVSKESVCVEIIFKDLTNDLPFLHWHTETQVQRQTDIQMARRAQTERKTDKQKDRHTDRRTDGKE